jgi:hypothetical protein
MGSMWRERKRRGEGRRGSRGKMYVCVFVFCCICVIIREDILVYRYV